MSHLRGVVLEGRASLFTTPPWTLSTYPRRKRATVPRALVLYPHALHFGGLCPAYHRYYRWYVHSALSLSFTGRGLIWAMPDRNHESGWKWDFYTNKSTDSTCKLWLVRASSFMSLCSVCRYSIIHHRLVSTNYIGNHHRVLCQNGKLEIGRIKFPLSI